MKTLSSMYAALNVGVMPADYLYLSISIPTLSLSIQKFK